MATLYLDSPGAFFPPLQEGDETPEFIRWAIDYQCSPREQHRGDQLEGLFRQLRPLAALGDAQAEGRIDSRMRAVALCDATRYEFDAKEILSFYGANEFSEVACLACPANGQTRHFPSCIGIISLGATTKPFFAAIETALTSPPENVPVTKPRWYGLWTNSPIEGERLKFQTQIVADILPKLDAQPHSLVALLHGMQTAVELHRPFHVELHPLGFVTNGRWETLAHCGFCGDLRAPRQRVCERCRREDAWKSHEKRHLLGIRPYRAAKEAT